MYKSLILKINVIFQYLVRIIQVLYVFCLRIAWKSNKIDRLKWLQYLFFVIGSRTICGRRGQNRSFRLTHYFFLRINYKRLD